jgi:hypothetical protein
MTQELTLHESSPVNVVIEAHNIPPRTVIQLQFFSERGPSQIVATTPLDGTFELSRATASITFPSGSSHMQMKATW